MNLSPDWVTVLESNHHQAVHWSKVGNPRAPDPVLLEWARASNYLLFTNDLDFGRLLALTFAVGPSVLQIRGADLLPGASGWLVLATLEKYEKALRKGALVVIDESSTRVRLLPIV